MKAPILYREARVWWKCPEIRQSVGWAIALRITYIALAIPSIIVAFPFFVLAFLTAWIAPKLEASEKAILFPANWLRHQRKKQIEKSREILPLEEIQKRVGKTSQK
ncbi:hypothetical protein [Sulfitobacter sp. R18_1]|uniref:hypothetical protein n=1 Tax=Sulfitobacter sp. R18_1 TaxID=2821104 RepID=UPI001ADB6F25|nr:hypothetical protein [Sulfitobacter sp. R18_1]MBO9427981.1 hypothetical protein [Sulfitobacter sp. R18_1]